MADSKPNPELKEYADGWITERKGTDVPVFLKFAYLVIAFGCITYAVVYMNGETTHATRGALVQQMNQATQTADGFMWFVALLTTLFAVLLAMFAFRKPHED